MPRVCLMTAPRPSPEAYRRLLVLVAQLGAATPEQLAAVSRADPGQIRAMVASLVHRRQLRVIETTCTLPALRPAAGQGRRPEAIFITEEGWKAVQAAALLRHGRRTARPRSPRSDQVVHHLLVVAAVIDVLRQRQAELVALAGDEELRSESRIGRRLRPGERDVQLPDARLTLRTSAGAVDIAEIEILVSKYRSADIVAKYRALPPATLFFAPTARLCARVAGLGFPAPRLLR